MTMEENKALLRQFYDEVINRGNLGMIEKATAANIVDHSLAPGLPPGVEGVKQWFGMMRKAFPDARVTVNDILGEGDKVVTRVTLRGTHKGEFLGVPATGKPVSIEGIDISRFSGGKLVEHWGQFDALGLMQQLGAVPPPGKPSK